MLESEELFVRKAGEEITEQLYNFEVGGAQTARQRAPMGQLSSVYFQGPTHVLNRMPAGFKGRDV